MKRGSLWMIAVCVCVGLTAVAADGPRVERRKPLTARVGIVGVGHHVYWAQFDGLLDELKGKMTQLEKKVQGNGVETVSFGILDKAQDAYDVLPKM